MYRRAFLCLALSACAAPAPRIPAPAITGRVTAPDFGDADPVDWGGRGPSRFAVHGIDASRWQGGIDWSAVRASGVNFAFLKATEGGDRTDPRFETYREGANAAGVPTGAYHFFYWCGPPETQARWFLDNAAPRRGDLPAVLDLEWTPFSPTCTIRPPRNEVLDRARRFLAIVAGETGQMPIIYTTTEFEADTNVSSLGTELWLRSTARPVEDAYPGTRWRFWQYTATGRVRGIAGNVDLNAFNGSAAEWQAWRTARTLA